MCSDIQHCISMPMTNSRSGDAYPRGHVAPHARAYWCWDVLVADTNAKRQAIQYERGQEGVIVEEEGGRRSLERRPKK